MTTTWIFLSKNKQTKKTLTEIFLMTWERFFRLASLLHGAKATTLVLRGCKPEARLFKGHASSCTMAAIQPSCNSFIEENVILCKRFFMDLEDTLRYQKSIYYSTLYRVYRRTRSFSARSQLPNSFTSTNFQTHFTDENTETQRSQVFAEDAVSERVGLGFPAESLWVQCQSPFNCTSFPKF